MKPRLYKGIEYIEIKEIPSRQRTAFAEWSASEMKLIKILMEDEKVVSNCVQFKDYAFWKENVYEADQLKDKADKKPVED